MTTKFLLKKLKDEPKRYHLVRWSNSVYEEGSYTIDPEIYNLGVPVLGICYGMQLTTKLLGGKVERCKRKRIW